MAVRAEQVNDLHPPATADTVIAPSTTVLREAARRVRETSAWQVVPSCLLYDEGAWLDQHRRERVRAYGPIHVLAQLAQAVVVIVPSLTETFGLVAPEAMNVGSPVVAYDVGTCPNSSAPAASS
ncbi:hypothetical protein GCM10010116_40750 [Microbispora rosea subsp. aerata]|nr:glycosyltransferase [Microbispora rosea]GGO20332.1 hypothetical protein GCM10010116_40750 [Microbispora rosea subsp. aerata]GIH57188.1 hypothetical protein Mro02_41020 [Microbispora rosea subsp. aerata]GLJ84742.1 hypothetical protein GCM10017588_34700 [Microbispora rosea subsp. aerata]